MSGRPVRRSMSHTWACSPHAAPTIPLSGNELRSWQPRKSSSGAHDAVVGHRLVGPVGVTGVDDRQLLDLARRRRVVERHLDDLDDAVVDLAALLRAERAAGRALAERVARVQHVHRPAARRGQQRVRVRAAVLVDGRDLLRLFGVRDVEDPDALPGPVRIAPGGRALADRPVAALRARRARCRPRARACRPRRPGRCRRPTGRPAARSSARRRRASASGREMSKMRKPP